MSFFKKKKKHSNYFTVAFYNLENLFDTHDDHLTNDDDFLPDSERRWTKKRYQKKLRKLGYTISQIGLKSTNKLPVIVGLAEVENKLVLRDLVNSKFLKNEGYAFVHYDSPDERGIDTALLYNSKFFEVINTEVFSINLFDEDGLPDHTRDILCVEGLLNGEKIYALVNHWPSRSEGVEITEPKRLIASNRLIEVVQQIKESDANAKIIVMGDFNDDPKCKSVKNLVHNLELFNPMETLLSYKRGSLNYRFNWNLFDQIMFSTNFFEHAKGKHRFSKANIFDDQFLKQFKGKYKGNPFRTYVGLKYKGGYSDHFPVYLLLKKG
ncbi:MAG: endonuclease [Bacteroidia bacterium]|nr:endonuclease [Bacteroidia bacterium]NND25199.1 endonuclease [Flavobacteriaceae bacterium]MBT8277641.1 endonuclease [Bacteroidia bacterium]NNK60912.1 endonuclease [Flavobacteriaceae bacterium]NNL31931.1 endonuclease [Flavobacteriaceae bacterium]